MKVFQCIHKYAPHIPYFEQKYGINDDTEMTFDQLRTLLIEDGYASSYILKPALEGDTDKVFYTIWDYERLQLLWAREQGFKTKDLDQIKAAQIEELKPEVFYNHSPYYDNNFIKQISHKDQIIKACWDAIITPNPSYHTDYSIRLTLFEPYVKLWNQHGYPARILPPAFPPAREKLGNSTRDIDILFYGQYGAYFFSGRNDMLRKLVPWAKSNGFKLKLHLQGVDQKKPLINVKGIRRITRWLPVAPRIISQHVSPPIYGQQLYETIANSKIVINAFTNYNGLFKDNMRNYEAFGCGALLISEDGIYPDHFEPNKDFLTYRSADELLEKIKNVLSTPDQGLDMATKAHEKLKLFYTKERQWDLFKDAIRHV
ncbi:MAG: glycosyltransferase [Bacteroidales bacterium]|nr:glycosyltransferase [Bacteroidales bacterium]